MKTLQIDTRVPCQDQPELFGGDEGERTNSDTYKARIRAARSLCASCPVWAECRQLGRELGEQDVWGGEDDRQRRRSGTPQPRRTPSGQNLRGTRSGDTA